MVACSFYKLQQGFQSCTPDGFAALQADKDLSIRGSQQQVRRVADPGACGVVFKGRLLGGPKDESQAKQDSVSHLHTSQ